MTALAPDAVATPARPAGRSRYDLQRVLAAVAVALSCTTALAWILLSPTLPLARDQGILAWVGSAVLSGGLPYADAWEHKGPLSHFLYALALGVFGKSEAAIHWFDGGMLGIAWACYVSLGRRWGSGLAGSAAFGLLFLQNGGDYWNAAQPDEWAGILLLGATVLVLRRGATGRAWLLSGVLIGLAALIKPLYLLHAVVPLTCAPRTSDRFLARGARVTAGVALPVLACCAVYLERGQAGQLIDAYLRFNLVSHAGRRAAEFGQFWSGLSGVWHAPGVLLTAALAALGHGSLAARDRHAARALLAATAISFLIGCLQNKFYAYHFLPFAIFLAALAGRGVVEVAAWRGSGGGVCRRRALGSFLLVWLLATSAEAASQTAGLRRRPAATTTVLSSDAPAAAPWESCTDFCYRDIVEAAAYVRRETPPGTPIYLWGFDALVYFLAERPAATRFGFNYPLLVDALEQRLRARAEVMRDLKRSRPELILVQDGDANNLYFQSSRASLAEFLELTQLLASDYTVCFHNPSFAIYRRTRGG